MKKIKKADMLNKLQQAQLMDCIKAGCTVRLFAAPKSLNKGWTDTALFNVEQPKLF